VPDSSFQSALYYRQDRLTERLNNYHVDPNNPDRIVTSPDVLAREELNHMEFHVTYPNTSCRWSTTGTGTQAGKIKVAPKPMSVCG